jgi:hypothetical protein
LGETPHPPFPLQFPVRHVPLPQSFFRSSLLPWFTHLPDTHFWQVPQSVFSQQPSARQQLPVVMQAVPQRV